MCSTPPKSRRAAARAPSRAIPPRTYSSVKRSRCAWISSFSDASRRVVLNNPAIRRAATFNALFIP
ncbi:MAG: hypothetical protein DMF91_15820 [Acidobacteria bacterium]|nr:MAG: hypothetical protein DMF91_15820 [Acidobacteriota bacterium]